METTTALAVMNSGHDARESLSVIRRSPDVTGSVVVCIRTHVPSVQRTWAHFAHFVHRYGLEGAADVSVRLTGSSATVRSRWGELQKRTIGLDVSAELVVV